MKNKIVIAGGAGFLGKSLARHFSEKGYLVTILSRGRQGQEENISYVKWDGVNPGPWLQELEGIEALINLSGRSVDCRYTEENKKEIISSRVNSTRAIGNAIRQCAVPPKIWMNASSATIYRHAEDRAMDEQQGEIGEGFSVDVCREWEKELNSFETPRTRKVALRIAMVLSKEDGVMKPMMNLVRFGMGGSLSGGNQYISWIHATDFVRMIEWILRHEELSGPLNICAPNPLPNREFMKQLRKAMGMPFGMPQPSWVMRLGAIVLQTETELIEKSRRVVPGTILKSGFEFSFPDVKEALNEITR